MATRDNSDYFGQYEFEGKRDHWRAIQGYFDRRSHFSSVVEANGDRAEITALENQKSQQPANMVVDEHTFEMVQEENDFFAEENKTFNLLSLRYQMYC